MSAETAPSSTWKVPLLSARIAVLTTVAQDDLRSDPQGTMDALCDRIGLDHGGMDFTKYFRPGADLGDSSVYSPELLAEAQALYEELNTRAVRASVAVEA